MELSGLGKAEPSPGELRVAFKIWLEFEGKPVLGEGGYQLLCKIEELGSIAEASRSLGISYRKALAYIRRVESRLSRRVVETRRGGRGGGGEAHLTPLAHQLIERYRAAVEAVKSSLACLQSS